MTKFEKRQLNLLFYLLCLLVSFSDASIPSCEGSFKECFCHYTYKEYEKNVEDGQQTNTRHCLKFYAIKKNWHNAQVTCEKDFSQLLHRFESTTLFQELGSKSADFVWVGIKRVSGFFVNFSNSEPYPFKESIREWGKKWSSGEPVYDCVALSIGTGRLITLPCTDELEFVCQNNGLPLYPVANTLACPVDWLFFYQLPIARKKCIKAFRKSKSNSEDAEKMCRNKGGALADLEDYFSLHAYMSESNITNSKTPGNDSDSCDPKILLAVLGTSVIEQQSSNCADHLFVCEQDVRNISLLTRIIPRTLQPFSSTASNRTLLTCDVSVDGNNLNGLKDQLQYEWFKNGVPISVNKYHFELGYYPDPFKALPSNVTYQGVYQCGANIVGLQERYLSPEENYFYSDISTFILTLHGKSDKLGYMDFSQLGFRTFRTALNQSMVIFTEELKTLIPSLVWDFQNASLSGNNATIKILLYMKRNPNSCGRSENITELYQVLQQYITERKYFIRDLFKMADFELTLDSADVCFQETVSSLETSSRNELLWKDTMQTRNAVSEPLCLNDRKLETRECKPSVAVGAKWMSFNYTKCSRYQSSAKDADFPCPSGFQKLKGNLCYAIHPEKRTFAEADEICRHSSSFLMDFEAINDSLCSDTFKKSVELNGVTKYWVANKQLPQNMTSIRFSGFMSSERGGNLLNIDPLISGNSLGSFNQYALPQCGTFIQNQNRTQSFTERSCGNSMAFVCLHRPHALLSSIALSKTWNKLSQQETCYYLDGRKKTWEEARTTCSNLSEKSALLQSIRDPEAYALFRQFIATFYYLKTAVTTWWINFVHEEQSSLRWFGASEVNFVDWAAHTEFIPQNFSAAIMYDSHSDMDIKWSLKDPTSKEGFICEMTQCRDNRPTFAYIEVRSFEPTFPLNNHSAVSSNLLLRCVPSGWFVFSSMSWFKDGSPIISNSSVDSLSIWLTTRVAIADIVSVQGYYWCSVNQDKPFKQISSSKVLFRFPGLRTYVLHIKSRILMDAGCSDMKKSQLQLLLELTDFLNGTMDGSLLLARLQNMTCDNVQALYLIHLYYRETSEDERKLNQDIQMALSAENEEMNAIIEKYEIETFEVRSTVSCPMEEVHDGKQIITWPATAIGRSAIPEELCITVRGRSLERECLGDFFTGAFWSPHQGSCTNDPSTVTRNLHQLSKAKITEINILNSSLEMQRLTSAVNDMGPVDLQYVAQILSNMSNVTSVEPQVLTSIISTVDNIISLKQFLIDDRNHSSNVSSRVSDSLERIVSNVNTNGQIFKAAGDNIAVSVIPPNVNPSQIPTGGILENWSSNLTTLFNGSDRDVYERFRNFKAGVLLPDDLVARYQSGGGDSNSMAIIIQRNIHLVEGVKVVSPVIGVSLGSGPLYDIDPPLKMIFKVPEIEDTSANSSYACVFWDQRLNNDHGGWSYKGCVSHLIDPQHVRCLCDHMTSFAVILELQPGSKLLKVHQMTLSIITYVGCSLSIFGLGIILLTYILFRKWRKDVKHKALFNLSLALISFFFIFLVGIERTGSRNGCMAIAVSLHFFMLASFAWMLVEAFMQYLSLVKVIGTYIPRFMQKAMLFAWGIPFTIVVIILSVNHNLYQNRHNFCWLSDRVFYYAVAGPVLAMLSMNFLFFGLILYSNTCGRRNKYLRTNQNERQESITRAKAIFCVSVLLGLSWIFGFLAVDGAKLVFQYLFATTTTLQGFLIFIFFVYRQKATRDLWLQLFLPSWTPDMSRISHITGGSDMASKVMNNVSKKNEPNRLSKVAYKAQLSYISLNS